LPGREDNLYHVLYGKGLDSTTVLDGVSVTGGYSMAPFFDRQFENCGGGILLIGQFEMESKPIIRNCRIFQNAANFGGGIYISWEDPRFSGSVKGRINPMISHCIIEYNYAFNDGGGIFKEGSMLLGDTFALRHCAISDNRARTNSGGGLSLIEGINTTLLLDNCRFERDSALDGGGCYYEDGVAGGYLIHFLLYKTQFNRNFAIDGGAFYYNGGGPLPYKGNVRLKTSIDSCTFTSYTCCLTRK